MWREWQLENGTICSLSKHPGEPVQSTGALWSFLALLSSRHSAPAWRSVMKLHNVRIAVSGFYPFSCCAALARLTLLSCELCPNDQTLVKLTVLLYFAAFIWKHWQYNLSSSFCYMSSKKKYLLKFPSSVLETTTSLHSWDLHNASVLDSIFKMRDWVQATVQPVRNANLSWVDVINSFYFIWVRAVVKKLQCCMFYQLLWFECCSHCQKFTTSCL